MNRHDESTHRRINTSRPMSTLLGDANGTTIQLKVHETHETPVKVSGLSGQCCTAGFNRSRALRLKSTHPGCSETRAYLVVTLRGCFAVSILRSGPHPRFFPPQPKALLTAVNEKATLVSAVVLRRQFVLTSRQPGREAPKHECRPFWFKSLSCCISLLDFPVKHAGFHAGSATRRRI